MALHRNLVLGLSLAVVLAACSPGADRAPTAQAPATSSAGSTSPSTGAVEEAPQTVEVDRGLLSVTIVLPSDFIEFFGQGGSPESAVAEIGVSEYESLVSNPDGSVTLKLSRLQHNRIVADLESDLRRIADEIGSGEEGIMKVAYNRSLSEFDVTIDRTEADESATFWIMFALSLQYGVYALIAGEGEEAEPPLIRFIDAATGEVFETSEDVR